MAKKRNYAGGMIIDGIFASEAIDSVGEIFSVEGSDISDLQSGLATASWEHKHEDSSDDEGRSTHTASDHVGTIIYAKKIFSAADCDNDRERGYWDEIKLPFIYGQVRLYDGAGHQAASDLAAQIRDHHLNGEPLICRYSIEGSTVVQEGNVLKETLCKRVAITIKPCNRSCHSGVLEDPNSPFETSADDKDSLKAIKKSDTFQHPLYSRLSSTISLCNPWQNQPQNPLKKALTGGGADAAPSTLTQGDALARTELLKKWKTDAVAAVREWDGKSDVRKLLKNKLPQADDGFLDRFANLIDEFQVGKLRKTKPTRRDLRSAHRIVTKFEKLTGSLLAKAEKLRAPPVMQFNGRDVRPGAAEGLGSNVKGRRFDVLHRDNEHVFVVPTGHSVGDLQKWPLHQEGSHFRVLSNPVPAESAKIDADVHGLPEFTKRAAQKKLVDGLDVSGNPDEPPAFYRPGEAMFSSAWWKTPSGKSAYMKSDADPLELPYGNEFGRARRAALFHNLAHDYFGLGKYVPTTVALRHPKTGRESSISEQVPDAEHAHFTMQHDVGHVALPEHQRKKLGALHATGDLHKLAMMDLIMGNDDRHGNNYMFTSGPTGIQLIDPDRILNPTLDRLAAPGYLNHHHVSNALAKSQDVVHPAAMQWLHSLDGMKLVEQMRQHGVPEKLLLPSLLRLQWLQHHASPNMTMADVIERARDVNPTGNLGDVISTLNG